MKQRLSRKQKLGSVVQGLFSQVELRTCRAKDVRQLLPCCSCRTKFRNYRAQFCSGSAPKLALRGAENVVKAL